MQGVLGGITGVASIVIMTIWFCLRNSGRPAARRNLMIAWIVCLLMMGIYPLIKIRREPPPAQADAIETAN